MRKERDLGQWPRQAMAAKPERGTAGSGPDRNRAWGLVRSTISATGIGACARVSNRRAPDLAATQVTSQRCGAVRRSSRGAFKEGFAELTGHRVAAAGWMKSVGGRGWVPDKPCFGRMVSTPRNPPLRCERSRPWNASDAGRSRSSGEITCIANGSGLRRNSTRWAGGGGEV